MMNEKTGAIRSFGAPVPEASGFDTADELRRAV
jgi:hypothetical protein